jgi:hypothetical protein
VESALTKRTLGAPSGYRARRFCAWASMSVLGSTPTTSSALLCHNQVDRPAVPGRGKEVGKSIQLAACTSAAANVYHAGGTRTVHVAQEEVEQVGRRGGAGSIIHVGKAHEPVHVGRKIDPCGSACSCWLHQGCGFLLLQHPQLSLR